MAIQPIDLQILFTQLDQVAKSQSMQKEGLQMQQALQNVQIQKKTEERTHAVNESQTAEEVERIKNQNQRRQDGGGGNPKERHEGGEAEGCGEDQSVFQDPFLGKNIDFSG